MTSQITGESHLKCIVDGSMLEESRTSGEPSMRCPQCSGAWLTTEALQALEDRSFGQGMVKGQMRYGESQSERRCPHCGEPMTRFRYRGHNLELEACPNDAGFWLDRGEDRGIHEVMRERARGLRRSAGAQRAWRKARRGEQVSLLDRILDVFRR
jgi:Zn-finger nucleic acid-binding protein